MRVRPNVQRYGPGVEFRACPESFVTCVFCGEDIAEEHGVWFGLPCHTVCRDRWEEMAGGEAYE